MSESVQLKEIRKIVEQYDAKLKATDKRFRQCVQIIHEEGTVLFFNYAFLMKITSKIPKKELSRTGPDNDVWIIVFTEHHGFTIYHESDLYSYSVFKEEHSPLEELKL